MNTSTRHPASTAGEKLAQRVSHILASAQLPQQQHRLGADGSLLVTTHINHPHQLLPVVRYWLVNVRIVKPVQWHEELVQGLRQALERWDS